MENQDFNRYSKLIVDYAKSSYKKMFREKGGILKHNFIVPGACYHQELWDWDSWLTNIALNKIVEEDISDYEKGCVLNFLENVQENGWTPVVIVPDRMLPPFDESDVCENYSPNPHKPCLAQHARFIIEKENDASWLEGQLDNLEKYINFYFENCYHKETGLYYFIDDTAIGVDNDPCVFYRPFGSTASIYLNCLMYKELQDIAFIMEKSGKDSKKYIEKAENLKNAIREHLYDERDGFYYSADINLHPIDLTKFLHSGSPRHWDCLIMRIDVWTGMMPMWNGIATKEQAERMVKKYLDYKTFYAPYGIRSLSKMEKMYSVKVSGNPSCWLGPIWGIANYMTFLGLLNYGYVDLAKEMCEKTIEMFGKDIEENGEMHEYYDPETGKGVHNKGFQSWNLLVVNMIKWYEENAL